MYNLESYGLNNYKVSTNAVDEINDGLVFYISDGWSKISDEGYMFNEFEMMTSKLSLKRRKAVVTAFTHFYFCKFDEETEEIYMDLNPKMNLDDVVMRMIQACTAISTIINYGGVSKSDD